MNRFEAMLASPTLSSKELAMQVRMQREIPKEEANILRSEMFVPKVRLYDELTTLRFRRPGPEEESGFYRQFCGSLSSASGAPIPYRFFKGEFQRLMEELDIQDPTLEESRAELVETLEEASGGRGTRRRKTRRRSPFRSDRVRKAVESLSDPWRIQAYAALCARIALSSETEDPKHAAVAWVQALKLYRLFFDQTRPEESTTYKVQTEEKLKADTVEAWEDFLPQLLEEMSARVSTYIQEKRPESVTACLDVLQSDYAKLIDRFAGDRALSDAFLPYINALGTANSLKEAAALFENIPAALLTQDSRQDAPRAMLAAMTKEVERLQKSGNSVALVLKWANKLDAMNLYQNGAPLVKKAATDFYEACGAYARNMLGEKDKERQQKYADCLMSIMPEDIVIATNSGKNLCRDELLGVPTTGLIRSKYTDKMKNCSSEREAEALGREVYQQIQSTKMPGCQWDDLQRELMQTLIITVQKSGMAPKYQAAFFSSYSDSLPIRDKDLKTVGGYKRMLSGALGGGSGSGPVSHQDATPGPGLSKGVIALARFAKADDGTREKLDALLEVVKWALDHPDEDVTGDTYYSLAETCCRNAFVAALNKKNEVSDSTFERDYKRIMELAVSFLPKNYQFPGGGGKTYGSDLLIKLLDLDVDSEVRSRADKARRKLNPGIFRPQPHKPSKPVKPHKPHEPHTFGVFGQAVIRGLVKVLLALIAPGILTLVYFLLKQPMPIGWSYVRLVFIVAALFEFPLEAAKTNLEHDKSSKFWQMVQTQASMLYLPLVFVLTLRHFHLLPMKLWMIIVLVVYGVIWLLATIGTLVSSK